MRALSDQICVIGLGDEVMIVSACVMNRYTCMCEWMMICGMMERCDGSECDVCCVVRS